MLAEKEMTVADLKAHFSEALDDVRAGHTIKVLYGRKHEPVAQLAPLNTGYGKRKLGVLKGKGEVIFHDDFKFKSVEEFLGLE
jgi:antitoxin (DNA-binding transcriptional repressor) of toxin-antitoxin stability system